jgi:hypothetical protein
MLTYITISCEERERERERERGRGRDKETDGQKKINFWGFYSYIQFPF